MVDERLVTYRLEDGVGIISLNRPEKLNAISDAMRPYSDEAWSWAYETEDVRAIVIRGEGRSFCAGRDTTELGGGRDDGESNYAYVRRTNQGRIQGLYGDKPVVAAVRGHAIGGGCELALAADIRVGSPDTRLSLPEIKYGILPDTGGSQLATALAGPGRAKLLVLTGDSIDGKTAYEWGLLDVLVESDEVDARALEIAKSIAARSPLAVNVGKTLVDQMYTGMVANGIRQELIAQTALFGTEDYQEARAALREGREPQFKGR